MAPLVSTRAASGAIDASTAAAYEANGKGVKDDGRGRIARAVWGVMRGGDVDLGVIYGRLCVIYAMQGRKDL